MGMGSLSLYFTLFPTNPLPPEIRVCNTAVDTELLLPLSCLVLPVEAEQQKAPEMLGFLMAGTPKTDPRHRKGGRLSACFVACSYYQSSWDQLYESHF